MDITVAAILLQDGLASGAVYTMLAMGFVLVFTVTRIIFASYGDLIAYSALTLHALQQGNKPGTIYLIAVLALIATAVECASIARAREWYRLPRALLMWLVIPLVPAAAGLMLYDAEMPVVGQILLTIALVVPVSPLLYRIVFQPIETASTLTLLIVAVVLHYAISGIALMFFGPEGIRTAAIFRGSVSVFDVSISVQLIMVGAVTVALVLVQTLVFNMTLMGKALRATAYNRDGARLVGISTRNAGVIAFTMAGIIAAAVGILISPTITVYYDSGLMIGLKGFVGAVVGGFVSYALAAVGSLLVGVIESFTSFYASAYKDVVVFLAVIPIVLLRWLTLGHKAEDEEEEHA